MATMCCPGPSCQRGLQASASLRVAVAFLVVLVTALAAAPHTVNLLRHSSGPPTGAPKHLPHSSSTALERFRAAVSSGGGSPAAVVAESPNPSPGPAGGASELPAGRLSAQGRATKTVVLAVAIGVGENEGFCDMSQGSSWRTMLPAYLARTLPSGSNVLVWDEFHEARSETFANDCLLCTGEEESGSRQAAFNCREWFGREKGGKGDQVADLVVVFGSGLPGCRNCKQSLQAKRHLWTFPDIKNSMDQPWVGPNTRFAHFPITRDPTVLGGLAARFDAVVGDGDWIKPVRVPGGLEAFRRRCRAVPRTDRLVYNARYKQWKGQANFLKAVDPELLSGYTVEFFTSQGVPPWKRMEEMRRAAEERGIKIVIHERPVTREQLEAAFCGARGAVHFAAVDANPRSVSEFLMAELPVFVSQGSHSPEAVLRQPFVFPVDHLSEEVNDVFGRFMEYVRSNGADRPGDREAMDRFLREDMSEAQALRSVCIILGICE